MPKETVQLYKLATAGHYPQALALWQKMLPSLLFVCAGFGHYLSGVLRASQLRGFGNGQIRKPLKPLPANYENALREALQPLEETR